MRVLIQRVQWAEVQAAGKLAGRIGPGLLVYVGVAPSDTAADAAKLARKVAELRIFDDEDGKLNRNVQDVQGGVLGISNFTLMADARKGRRPALTGAAGADLAKDLYDKFLAELRHQGCEVAGGVFGAAMVVSSAADGPINIILDIPSVPDADAPEKANST